MAEYRPMTESDKHNIINSRIDALTSRINKNEKLQDEWIAKHGEENPSLAKQHDELCDEMETLCTERRNLHEQMTEAAADNGFEYELLADKENEGFEGMSIKDYLGYDPDLGMERDQDLANNGDYDNFFRDPKVMAKFSEHFDMTDTATRKSFLALTEADKGSVLTALTSKLYDNIVAKVDDIDYGDIPMSKGDITKLTNYDKLRECIELLRNILKEFKQDTGPIDVVSEAMANVQTRKDLFTRAFKYNSEFPIIMYNNTVLGIIDGVSYMIATCIEFMKTPNRDSFQITLDKVAYTKTKNNMIYKTLEKFNKCCKSGEFDKAMEHIIQHRIKGIGEAAAAIGVAAGLTAGKIAAGIAVGATVVGAILIISHIVPILREMVFLFYYTRMKVSEFFDIQADLLQMNAYNIQSNEAKTNEEKERIFENQMKIANFFRKVANKISFSNKKGEVDSSKEIQSNGKKLKIDDVKDDEGFSALF